jgi:hypothetical protein
VPKRFFQPGSLDDMLRHLILFCAQSRNICGKVWLRYIRAPSIQEKRETWGFEKQREKFFCAEPVLIHSNCSPLVMFLFHILSFTGALFNIYSWAFTESPENP